MGSRMGKNKKALDSVLTTSTAARVLGLAESTVRKLTRTGRLRPVATTETGIRLYDRAELERYRDAAADGLIDAVLK